MPRIQKADLVGKIRRAYGLRGTEGPETISPEIVPVAIVDELISQGGVRIPAISYAFQNAIAAKYSNSMIFNPADSGRIIRVESCFATPNGATIWYAGFRDSVLTTNYIGRWRDRTQSGKPVAQVYSDTLSATGVTTLLATGRMASSVHHEFPVDVVLEPGQGWILELGTVNLALLMTWFWTEEVSVS